MLHPQRVERLVVLNAPHPVRFLKGLRSLRQLRRSWYVLFFQLPWLPERLVRAKDFWGLRRTLRRGPVRPGAFSNLGSTGAMREEGRSRGYIIGVWTGVAVACVLATVAGYALLGGLSPGWVSAVLALAAGGSWRCWPTRCSPRPLSMAAGGSRWPPRLGSPARSC